MTISKLREIIESRINGCEAILKECSEERYTSSEYWEGKLAGYMAVADIMDDPANGDDEEE